MSLSTLYEQWWKYPDGLLHKVYAYSPNIYQGKELTICGRIFERSRISELFSSHHPRCEDCRKLMNMRELVE